MGQKEVDRNHDREMKKRWRKKKQSKREKLVLAHVRMRSEPNQGYSRMSRRGRERVDDRGCPSFQRPASCVDVTNWETQNKPLSAELLTRFPLIRSGTHNSPTFKRLPSDTPQHLLQHPLSPALPLSVGHTIISTPKHCTTATRKATWSLTHHGWRNG